jgi:hypothetical protein
MLMPPSEEARKLYPHEIRKQQKHYDDWNQENFRNVRDELRSMQADLTANTKTWYIVQKPCAGQIHGL